MPLASKLTPLRESFALAWDMQLLRVTEIEGSPQKSSKQVWKSYDRAYRDICLIPVFMSRRLWVSIIRLHRGWHHALYALRQTLFMIASLACRHCITSNWWVEDLAILANSACPQGGGTLTSDITPSLYIVISADAGTMNKGGATITNAGST